MRIVVVGSRGQLGAALVREGRDRALDVIALDHAALDVTDGAAVDAAILRARPDAVLNAAAYNAVDAAEDHAVDALQLNAIAVRNLARAAREVDAALVHYGSDFVFDGRGSRPYAELDTPNPQSVYAWSKLLGEWFAADIARSYVLRVESLFGMAEGGLGKGSVAGIVGMLRAGNTPRVFEDRTVSPTYVRDAARATYVLLEQRSPAGIYHCVNSGSCTWLELAQEAVRLLGVEPRLEIIKSADASLRAPRPQYCALSNAKLVSAGIPMPTWQEALKDYLSRI